MTGQPKGNKMKNNVEIKLENLENGFTVESRYSKHSGVTYYRLILDGNTVDIWRKKALLMAFYNDLQMAQK